MFLRKMRKEGSKKQLSRARMSQTGVPRALPRPEKDVEEVTNDRIQVVGKKQDEE